MPFIVDCIEQLLRTKLRESLHKYFVKVLAKQIHGRPLNILIELGVILELVRVLLRGSLINNHIVS